MNQEKEYQDQVEGRNAVLELLESGRDVNKILIEKDYNIHYQYFYNDCVETYKKMAINNYILL